jgi:hypothetical protein
LIILLIINTKYNILHIRYDDTSFTNDKNNNIKSEQLESIVNQINELNITDKTILLTNNSFLGLFLANKLSFLDYNPNIKEHTGNTKNTNGIIDTLIDFFIMSYAENICCLSTEDHGSGFSNIINQIYTIPYVSYRLNC